MAELFKNEAAKEYFRSSAAAGTLSHAYIIEGPHGSGRHTLVREVVSMLIPDSEAKKRMLAGNSPDVLEYGLADKRRTIGVETVRALRQDAFVRPSELDFRAFIISDADTMTPSAQNAALKILEEPPANVYFFLLCENSSSLLPTVRSRAQTIRLQRFSEEELDAYFLREPKYQRIKSTDPERYSSALRACDGAIGAAIELFDGSAAEKVNELAERIIEAFCRKSSEELLLSSLSLPSSRADADEVLSYLLRALRDLAAIKASSKCPPLFFPDKKSSAELARKISERSIHEAYERVSLLREQLGYNINMSNARASLAESLMSAAGL